MNRHLIDAFETLETDAANISYLDLPGLENRPIPHFAVSANVSSSLPIPTHLIVEKGDLRIGVTGITKVDASFAPHPSFQLEDPTASAIQVLEELKSEVDLLVLLAFDCAESAQEVAQAVPELDLIVDTRQNRQHAPPLKIGNTLWVKSHYQTMRLGELRVNTTETGQLELVRDRKIDLDPEISDEPKMLEKMDQAREAINAIQTKLFGLSE